MHFPVLWLGQLLKDKASNYTITKQLHESMWLATYEVTSYPISDLHTDQLVDSNQRKQIVVIKSVRHFRLGNERDVLKHFQTRTPSLCPLIDEIEDPPDPPALVLKHLDDDRDSATQRLTKFEIKHVTKKVLEALNVLHGDGCTYRHDGGTSACSSCQSSRLSLVFFSSIMPHLLSFAIHAQHIFH